MYKCLKCGNETDIEELKFKNEEEFEFTKEGLEEFLTEFSKAIKKKK